MEKFIKNHWVKSVYSRGLFSPIKQHVYFSDKSFKCIINAGVGEGAGILPGFRNIISPYLARPPPVPRCNKKKRRAAPGA